MKGSAVSKSSNVRGRGLSISIYYIILAICTSTLICIRPAGAPTSGLKFCLAGTPGVIAVFSMLDITKNDHQIEWRLALSLSTAAAAEITKKQIGNQLYNRLSCQLGPDTQGHFLRMGGGGWLSAKDFLAVQPNLNMGLHIFLNYCGSCMWAVGQWPHL
ncbi:hypothetical protein DPMN_169169 [Dreissena polymorpha]|uniref:Uncharacterized protein n=1 Tax=Dreissena polymorpha TaxID=45954 RepID=A0A9D4F6J0_DREPO|nr:hypothetical protein DPMN_169169 [Dreissena polymorpha]